MKIEELIDKGDHSAQDVRAVLNILLEAPYFYKTDDERLFLTLMRYKKAFAAFFEKFYGWTPVMDEKCARLYKPKWYNECITPPNRDMFTFTRLGECVAFLVLLEFFEREAREQGVGVDDAENLRFRYGDLLEYAAGRFRALFPDKRENYGDERVRQILRDIVPTLIRYRFLRKVKLPDGAGAGEADTIFECLPAMWHYQAAQLAELIGEHDLTASPTSNPKSTGASCEPSPLTESISQWSEFLRRQMSVQKAENLLQLIMQVCPQLVSENQTVGYQPNETAQKGIRLEKTTDE